MKKIIVALIILVLFVLPVPAQASSLVTYVDTLTDLTFIVPSNWTEVDLSQEREFIDIMFTSDDELGFSITYGSIDFWDTLPASEKAGYARSEIDNSIFSVSDINKAFGALNSTTRAVKFGDTEYFEIKSEVVSTVGALKVNVPVIQLIKIDNGYMYFFQFTGETSTKQYKDFETLVSSAKYKNEGSDNVNIGTYDDVPAINGTYTKSYDIYSIIAALIIATICGLIIGFIARKRGWSFWAYFLIGFVLNPFIAALILHIRKAKEEKQQDNNINKAAALNYNVILTRRKIAMEQYEKDPDYHEQLNLKDIGDMIYANSKDIIMSLDKGTFYERYRNDMNVNNGNALVATYAITYFLSYVYFSYFLDDNKLNEVIKIACDDYCLVHGPRYGQRIFSKTYNYMSSPTLKDIKTDMHNTDFDTAANKIGETYAYELFGSKYNSIPGLIDDCREVAKQWLTFNFYPKKIILQ